MPLSEIVIRQAKPGPKAIKIFDGRGLYLLLSPNGSRGWRFKYRVDGREKLISFGIYPDVPLKLARDRREEARQQLAAGIDPGAKRKAEKVPLKPAKRVKRKESFAAGVGRGLRLAAKAARKTARMYGTPIYVSEGGKVVAKKP